MTREKKNVVKEGSRWVRVGVLALTTAGPIVNTIMERLRQRSQSLRAQTEDVPENGHSQAAQATALDRLDELTLLGRRRVAEQAQQLQKQAQQWRSQAHQLRKALRKESRERRKLNKTIKQLRETGVDWSQDLLKRGEELTEGLVVQGGKLSHDLMERGSRVTRDFAKRSDQVRHDLVKRGGKFSHDLAERGEHLLQPKRKRNGVFWSIFGFSFGLVAAAIVTYFLVRKRLGQQDVEPEEHIELPQDRDLQVSSMNRPGGEIHHLNNDGTLVATLHAVDVQEDVEAPADATFVGVVSTKRYYLVETALEAKDLVYFASEEEAKAQGFSPEE
jgi:hypothetical protein